MTVANGSRTLKVGLEMPQMEGFRGAGVRSWKEMSEMAVLAEQVGFDSVWFVDHLLFSVEGEDRPRGSWEGWSLVSAVAAITERVEIGTLVLAMGWRNPALLAKMVSTVEEISGGRLILGLGSGYHKVEYDAFGFPFDYKVSRFEEAIQIVHGLLRNGEIDFEGRFHSARECELRPLGPREGGPPILIGTIKPRMLSITAKYADAWNAYYGHTFNRLERAIELLEIVDAACCNEGRDPGTLERTVTVLIADTTTDPRWDQPPLKQLIDQPPLRPLAGPPEEIARILKEYEREGVAHIQICMEPTTLKTIEELGRVLEVLDAAT